MLSAIMKAEKQSQGARALKGDEKFGNDDYEEKRMAQAIIYLKNQKRKMSTNDKGTTT